MQFQLALLTLAAVASASTPQGFNYGSTKGDGSAYSQSDFESLFQQAQNLPGTSGFTSARLYTMMQGGTTDQIISAIPAAIKTKTQLLLGMWVSTGGNDPSAAYNAEKAVLQSAIKQYGDDLKNLLVGISVGSEDLYRDSPLGKTSKNPGPGQNGTMIASFIKDTKSLLQQAGINVPVGHVDTWTAWTDSAYSDAVEATDFLGVDAYPYWQLTEANGIENGKSLFNEAYDKTKGVAGSKDVWITETGWAVSGPSEGSAVANTQNAQKYWQDVGCQYFGKVPTFWYTLEESPTSDNPDFSIFNAKTSKPYFDLSCSGVSNSTSTTSAGSSSSTGTSSGSSNGTYTSGSPSKPTSGSGSGSSGSGSSGSGSGSSGSGTKTGTASSSVSTAGAASMSVFSAGSLLAVAAAVAALL